MAHADFPAHVALFELTKVAFRGGKQLVLVCLATLLAYIYAMFRWRIRIFGQPARHGAVMAPDEETAKQKAIAIHNIPKALHFSVVVVKIEEAKKPAKAKLSQS